METRVLLVDDEGVILACFARIMPRFGYVLDTASDGEKGLELLKQHKHKIVITDLIMPNLSGIEFLRQASQVSPKSSYIVISGGEDRSKELSDLPVAGYIQKPFTPQDLIDLIAKYTDDK